MTVPANLLLLHKHEEESMWAKSLELVNKSPDLADHLDMMERAMDVLDMLRKHHTATDHDRALTMLGLRCFNSFAASWKLTATGYYQASAALLRDIIETSELVDYIREDPELIQKWLVAERKQRVSQFGPKSVRDALDKRMGLGKSQREAVYQKFCNLATHPSPVGFAMLCPTGMDAHNGPFVDPAFLRGVLEETGRLAALAGFVFVMLLDKPDIGCKQVEHRFLIGVMDYSGKYLGKTYSHEERAELDEIFGGEA